ncbi:hypothetical protein [Mycobacterium sp. NPDC050853]|uniref:hypothetical protein n=1 Tax=Mycobacterium sp. NPDC050853 TaxID=3155160 RepID=UPI0033EFE576
MTIVPPPVEDTAMRIWEFPEDAPEPPPRWSQFTPGESQLRAAAFGTLVGLLFAVVMGAAYGAQPGGSLWALDRTVFPAHSQDVAVRAVVSQLKNAQDILGTGKQPSPDQLTTARTSLNEAKRGLEFVSASDERTSLQNLYLQLTQQLRQYTPEQAQQLPALPAAPGVNADANLAANASPVGPSTPPPSWGYAAAASAPSPAPQAYSAPLPPGIPVDPVADWPAPVTPPLTPNLGDLGGYDPSWMLLYGYNVVDWFNWGLSGFNRYGYDFTGFDRWGYDRWGYDRWGYDRWGYNWDGYNWSGYNHDGRDRDGRNEWGQRNDNDPRDQGWYDRYHPFRQYYEWKFQNTNPVFSRNLWDQSHGIDPTQYRDWNLNRNWDNPLERDWSPVTSTARVADRPAAAEPVVSLDASLAQFLADDKSARPSADLVKDLSTKSVRNFSKELAAPASAPEQSPKPASPTDEKSSTPPALTVTAPVAPPKQVPEDFTPPSLPAVPAVTPVTRTPSTEPRATSGTTSPAPSTEPSQSPTPTSEPSAPAKATTSAPAPAPTSVAPAPTPKDETSAPVTTPAAPTPVTPETPASPVTPAPRQTVTAPPVPTAEPSTAPEPTRQRSTPSQEAPTPEPRATVEPAPQQVPVEAPAKQAPVEREAPQSRASAPEPAAPTREAPTREAPTYSTPAQAPSAGGGHH